MTAAFTETAPHEARFAEIYVREIAPRLGALEQERQRLKASVTRRLVLMGVIAAIILIVVAAINTQLIIPAIILLAILVVLLGGSWAMAPGRRFQDRVREIAMPPVCRFLGGLDYRREGDGVDLAPFTESGVVGRHSRARVEDVFTGRHRNTGFTMAEALLQRSSGSGKRRRTVTVFKGLLLSIEVPRAFTGTLLITPDRSRLGRVLREMLGPLSGMPRVEVPHPRFEERFELYADNAALPRELLTTDFLESMVAIADAVDAPGMTVGFTRGRFLMALPMPGDLFSGGSVFRPVGDATESLRLLLRQASIAFRLIDYLHGERPGALA